MLQFWNIKQFAHSKFDKIILMIYRKYALTSYGLYSVMLVDNFSLVNYWFELVTLKRTNEKNLNPSHVWLDG